MNSLFWRIGVAALFAFCFALSVLRARGERRERILSAANQPRYSPDIVGFLLPFFLLLLIPLLFLLTDFETAKHELIALTSQLFAHICLYYLLLLPALPWLRRHFSARACALLWLLPNYLYFTQQPLFQLSHPQWVIPVPGAPVQILFVIWLIGFFVVFLWKIVDHLVFRRRILKDSYPITAPAVMNVWRQALEDARVKDVSFQLVSSPQVSAPLSIGLFRSAIRVVLPRNAQYTPDELTLIFRHELVHIERRDSWTNFFLMFCTAICWFNPLMWIAMSKSAEDLELNCDEMVLLHENETVRQQYAHLLLDTAGSSRGFTTCLAASANAMRHRLKSIVRPAERSSGALLVGIVFFLLFISCGHVALAYGGESGEEIICAGSAEDCRFTQDVTLKIGEQYTTYSDIDDDPILEYLASLKLYRIAGNYSFSVRHNSLSTWISAPDSGGLVDIMDDTLFFYRIENRRPVAAYYHIAGGVDWDKLQQLVHDASRG